MHTHTHTSKHTHTHTHKLERKNEEARRVTLGHVVHNSNLIAELLE